MKRVLMIVVFVLFTTFVSPTIDVDDYSIKTTYMPESLISGNLTITATNIPSNALLTNNRNEEILFKTFLDANKKAYNCSPADCSISYIRGDGGTDINVPIANEKKYVGVFLKGKNIEITDINFSLESDFESSATAPLKLKFFEDKDWEFSTFSDEYNAKNWGCYSPNSGATGPLIRNSNYCELISFFKSDSFFIGARVDDSDDEDLKMLLYSREGQLLGDCSFNPTDDEEGCEVRAGEGDVFENGTYQVCIGAEDPTDYHIYEETVGKNCGYVHSMNPNESVKDYAVFGQSAKYSTGSSLNSNSIEFNPLVDIANDIIGNRYGGDCTEGCILPIELSGVSQNLRFFNVAVDYSKDMEDYVEKNIYSLSIEPAKIDFEGTLDLSKTNFTINEEGDYILYLEDEKLFEEEINFLPAPIIKSLFPKNPPAGIPVTMYVGVEFNWSYKNLEYRWSFDNKSYETTKENHIVHTFSEIKNNTVLIEVRYQNLTTNKTLVITTVSPENSVNRTLIERRTSLNRVKQYLSVIPGWYMSDFQEKINISHFESSITRLESEYRRANRSEDYLRIAKELFSFDYPVEISVIDEELPFLRTGFQDVNPEVVLSFTDETTNENLEDYKDPIISWMDQYLEATILAKKVFVIRESGTRSDILNYYQLNIKNNAEDEGYLFIGKPQGDLRFKEGSSGQGESGYTVIPIGPSWTSADFYYYGDDELSYFVSPSLSTFILETQINKNCNFNNICESGEDYKTCRTDCKPYNKALIYGIIIFVVFLVVYTILQVWYKNHYESYLFGDRRQIYNLLMYVANARARGVNDSEIRKALKDQGWSSERINYIMRKSYGKSVGMIEIIPISLISTMMRNKKAKQNVNSTNEVPKNTRETLINDERYRQQ